jgi:DNA polymerase delta subunit 1
MLRPEYKKSNDDILVQLNDWTTFDKTIVDDDGSSSDESPSNKYKKKWKKKKRHFTIRAFGITEEGHSISIDFADFKPFFFLEVPEGWNRNVVRIFKKLLQSRVNHYSVDSLIDFVGVEKIPFYGFCNYEKKYYIKLVFDNISGYYSYLKVLRETEENPIRVQNENYNFNKLLLETKISPLLRFFHIKQIKPVGWIKLKRENFQHNIPKNTRCQIDCTMNFDDVIPVDMEKIGKFVVASYDIECTSCDGTFPNATRQEDEIIQIGTTINIFGDEKIYKYIATLKKSNPIEGVTVEEFETERDLLIGWCRFMKRLDPDIITGYNIWGFDWKYIYERALTGNGGLVPPYQEQLMKILSRVNIDDKGKYKAKYVEKELHSSALGQNFLYFISIEGIVQVDLYKQIMKDYNLTSYKLNAVSEKFMGQNKEDLKPAEIFSNYRRGTKEDIKQIATYCVQDCALCNNLLNKLQIIPNNVGMGNVCYIPFSYLFLRGQGIKIYSLAIKFCSEEGFLIKNLSEEDIDKKSYEGAIVFVPEPGIYYDPVAVMDYASLYPSSMISENISHDTLIGFKEYYLKDKKNKKDLDEYELRKDTYNEKYNNLPDYNYTDIEYDLFVGVDKDKRKVGYKVCRYAEKKNGEKGVLPRILQDLLKARRDTRKKIKYKTGITKDGKEYIGLLEEKDDEYIFKKVEGNNSIVKKENIIKIKDTYTYFQKAVLDGQQLAFKVTCNSLYGQVGASTSSICCKELAASTTATGRKMVIYARDYTLEKYQGSKLVYGDTDSVFINFVDYIKRVYGKDYPDGKIDDKEMIRLTIEVGKEAGSYVTSKLKRPQDLEYEKVFWPFMIFSKKRYYGNKYEFSTTEFKPTSMGIVMKRRDNAPIVKDIYGGIVDFLMNKRDVQGSYEFFRQKVRDLLNGKIDINKLIISKSLKANYANPTTIPHKMLADRMGERDPGNKPQSNDRLPYCYIDESNLRCKVCNFKIDRKDCKCTDCMELFCKRHIKNHSKICKKMCRFCRVPLKIDKKGNSNIKRCGTCFGNYCPPCFKKHMRRKDKYKKIHFDKCKKPLSTKLIQGDIIEEPLYIKENKLKIDNMYYLEHQIEKPVLQIFELIRKDPHKLLEDIKRDFNNKKNGQKKTIMSFFGKKK